MMARRCLSALLLLSLAASATAQTIPDEQRELRAARAEQSAAQRRAQRYEAAAGRATDAAEAARARAAAMAAKIQLSEASIALVETRIGMIERERARHRRRMAAQQMPLARLIAALQTMARRPPALTLVQPGAITDMIHTRLLLSSTLPVIARRTAGLRAEIARGTRLRAEANAAAEALVRNRAQLERRRAELARLEAAERLRSERLGDSAFVEAERAQALGEKARDIRDLMRQMDEQAGISARLASLSGPIPRPRRPGEAKAPPAEAAVASESRPAYRLPVIGRVITGMGELSEAGIRSRGLTFLARPGSQVIAPAGGKIRYAAPFRGYGNIVIIDHGSGWTTLVTGLAGIDVAVGATVDQGSPIGRTGGAKSPVTVELRRGGEAINIAPLAAGA